MILLERAYVCVSCERVVETRECCPRCGSAQVMPLSGWLNRTVRDGDGE